MNQALAAAHARYPQHYSGCDKCQRGEANLGHPSGGCVDMNRIFRAMQAAQSGAVDPEAQYAARVARIRSHSSVAP